MPERKTTHAPAREDLSPPEAFGITLHPDATRYAADPQLLADSYGGSGG